MNTERIREYLENNGMTEAQYAERCGLSEICVKNILNGKVKNPHPRTLIKLQSGMDGEAFVQTDSGFAERVDRYKAKRKELNLTDEELSAISGVSVRAIEEIFSGRNGNPRYATVKALDGALSIDGSPSATSWDEQVWLFYYRHLSTAEKKKAFYVIEAVFDGIARIPHGRIEKYIDEEGKSEN